MQVTIVIMTNMTKKMMLVIMMMMTIASHNQSLWSCLLLFMHDAFEQQSPQKNHQGFHHNHRYINNYHICQKKTHQGFLPTWYWEAVLLC